MSLGIDTTRFARRKFTDKKTKTIRKLFSEGVPVKILAQENGVALSTIYRMVKQETYRKTRTGI